MNMLRTSGAGMGRVELVGRATARALEHAFRAKTPHERRKLNNYIDTITR
jgi:hypothetical protein